MGERKQEVKASNAPLRGRPQKNLGCVASRKSAPRDAVVKFEGKAPARTYAIRAQEEAESPDVITVSELKIELVQVVCKFTDVFPEELPGLPSVREIEFGIELVPGFLSGSASLASSNMTLLKMYGNFQKDTPEERNLWFGVREHGMGAICNGITHHSPDLILYCATFFVFTDYMRAAIRMSLMETKLPVHTKLLSSIETHLPLSHTLQKNYPNYPELPSRGSKKVATFISDNSSGNNPDIVLIETDSELEIVVKAGNELRKDEKAVRVVSLVSWELFDNQSDA
ncbi:transketolase, chloroplastic-like [Gossypium hirsutum]|uniref:Transketolase, chloroplastic-like n=1 Tax=Gossypium hirsutum TaxID=3635 RepID=A0ABM2ZBS0_GOSHI|nr:transketolase, chloroplastic-like [Gossypium hirsutum]